MAIRLEIDMSDVTAVVTYLEQVTADWTDDRRDRLRDALQAPMATDIVIVSTGPIRAAIVGPKIFEILQQHGAVDKMV